MTTISPYTRVIADCLDSLSEASSEESNCNVKQEMQLLVNMLQGRMLEHIKQRVSSYYHIERDALNEEFSVSLIEFFAEIFGLFLRFVSNKFISDCFGINLKKCPGW